MKEAIKEWRRLYDMVQILGKKLHDSRPTYTERGDYIEPLIELTKDRQKNLEIEIHRLIQTSSKYLNFHEVMPNEPLWKYDHTNPETHFSSKKFKYGYLIKKV